MLNKNRYRHFIYLNIVSVLVSVGIIVINKDALNLYSVTAKFDYNEAFHTNEINSVNHEYLLGMSNINRVSLRELVQYILKDDDFLNSIANKYNTDNIRFKLDSSGDVSIVIPSNNTRDHQEFIFYIEKTLNTYVENNINNRFLSKLKQKREDIKSDISRYEKQIEQKYRHIKTILENFPNASFYIENGILLDSNDALSLFEEPANKKILMAGSNHLYENLDSINREISLWPKKAELYSTENYSHSFNNIKILLLIILLGFISLLISGILLVSCIWIRNDRY